MVQWIKFDRGFSKEDLKTGMTVETCDEGLWKVLLDTPNGDILVQNLGWMPLNKWNEDLTFYDSVEPNWNISKVYSPKYEYQTYEINNLYNYEMVFNANGKVVKKYTIEELEGILGCDIEIVK